MSISNTTTVKGLYTFGNEITQVEGSLGVADNVNIDEPSVVTPRRGFADIGQDISPASIRAKQLLQYKKTAIRHYSNVLEWENNNGQFSQFAGVYEQLDDDIRLKFIETNSNLYFTTKNGIMKISARNASDFSTASGYITKAGVPEAVDISAVPVITSTGYLPPQSKVAYKVLFGKKDINNNLQLGTPTSRFVVTNISKDVTNFEKAYFDFKEAELFLNEKTTLTCGSVANTPQTNLSQSTYILISSANNETTYGLYFDKGAAVIPVIPGVTWVRVDLTASAPGDNVAPVILSSIISFGNLTNIAVSRNGTEIVFNNVFSGVCDGVRTATGVPSTDIGGGWAIVVNQSGNESRYVEKYFIVPTKTVTYCFYYGNSDTIGNVPSDPSLTGMVFISILISNNSTRSFIANQTSQAMITSLSENYNVELAVGASPYIVITDINGGDVPDVSQGVILPASLEITVVNQGALTKGQNANVNVTFTIPSDIDTSFFFRIYRTGYLSAIELGISLSDIDPGEECFLVYEGPVTTAVGSKVTILDITPETFRQSGEPLYNNPSSGDGTISNNDAPPISKDICNYKGFTFYSNTRSFQRLKLDLISLDGFVSGDTKFVAASPSSTRVYTFRGEATNIEVTCSTKSDTTIHSIANPDAKIIMYSASNETKYVIYFDDGTGSTPIDTDSILVRVNIADLDPTDNVSVPLVSALSQIPDFTVISNVSDVISLQNSENGPSITTTTGSGVPSTDLGAGWNIVEIDQGIGEDIVNGFILLSASSSVSIKLERTSRSIINVINGDPLSTINIHYTSGQNDLPGKMGVTSKSISNSEFYLALIDGVSENFTPDIPLVSSTMITDIVSISPEVTELEIIAHDFVDGESVYFNIPNILPPVSGKYTVKVIDIDHIQVDFFYLSGTLNDSFFFFPYLESDNSKISNRLMYSKRGIPEAVPTINYIDIGTRDEPIERILSIRDYLFILKSDGIFSLSGNDSTYFQVKQVDTERIFCPDSAVVLNNQIFMLAFGSILAINESSPNIVSRMIENKVTEVIRSGLDVRRLGFGVAYEDDRAYLLWLPTQEKDTVSTQCYRYNILERTWTRWTKTATCGLVVGDVPYLYIGDGDRSVVMKERKNRDRTDHADRDFYVSLSIASLIQGRYRLSDISEIERGDVAIQEQTVDVQEYNRLLKKLDIDVGFNYTDFLNDFECLTADNIAEKLTLLNIKLIELDVSGTITTHSFDNTDWVDLRVQYNALMGELNLNATVSSFKDYILSTRNVKIEYVVTEVDRKQGTVTFNSETSIIQGAIRIYKHIESRFRFNPIHFGNPSSLKQISFGYLLFDQNNFFKMRLEYKSDLSPSYEGSEFNGKGGGFWGSDTWGFPKVNNYWGGQGNDAPRRSVIPRNKQRCRYITPQIVHFIARDYYRIVGVAHDARETSNRAYRGI